MSGQDGMGLFANTLANLLVGAAALGYAVIVPAVVIRRFGTDVYGIWYLAFQISAYIVLLDLGSQYVVTNEAAAPSSGAEPARLTTAAMISQSGLALAVLGAAAGWAMLTGQGRLAQLIGILGVAATASLLASTVRAWFGGLRRAHVPAVWLICARGGSLAGLSIAVAARSDLVALTTAVAVPQLVVHVGLLVWARRPPSPWARPDRAAFARLLRASLPLALWTACGVVIGGIDIFIVRAVDPSEVGRYAIALPLLAIPTGAVTAATTAWLPRVSGAGAGRRDLTLMGTTLMAAALCVGAVPFIGFADNLVHLLAGRGHLDTAATYLQLLYVATSLRFVFLPWAILIVARGEQGMIISSPIAEATTNLVASVLLGLWIGAVGVALGTLAGASVASVMHLGRGVRRTSGTGIGPAHLVLAAGRAWPTLAAACALAVLAVAHAPTTWRGVTALVALVVDAWWLFTHKKRTPGGVARVAPAE